MLNFSFILKKMIYSGIIFISMMGLKCAEKPEIDYKIIVHTFNKAWNTGQYELLKLSVHSEYFKQEGDLQVKGIEALTEYIKNWRKSLPDAKITYIEEVYGGEKAAILFTLEGTPMDTQKKFKAEGIVIFRFKDGKIVEDKSVFDQLTSLQQQGYTIKKPTIE